jgi:membrane associated rhomboid family serine protease
MSIATDIRAFYQRSGIVIRFILLNLLVFVTIVFINLILKLSSASPLFVSGAWYLAAPSHPQALLEQPWSIITYMFTHEQIFHFLFNMIMLYFSGIIFMDVLGSRKFPGVYVIGGIFGFLFYFTCFNLLPAFKNQAGVLLGASASVMAVFVSVGVFRPHYVVQLLFFGPVKLYVLVLIYVLLDLARLSSSVGNPLGNSGGWLAHLGGAGFGAWFGYAFRKSRDITGWYDRFFDRIRNIFSGKRKPKTVKIKTHTATAAWQQKSSSLSKDEKQEKIDRILDKISRSGYESLTSTEKEFLFKNSKDV